MKKFTRAIVEKTHLVWRLNDARLAHLKDLFLNAPGWPSSVPLPEYGSPNPFRYFSSIPARVRSTFLMENARIIVAGMTQGSVCIGSTATYAIADHFWAWFLRPESDPSVTNPMLGLDDVDVFATAPLPWRPKNDAEWAVVARLDRLTGPDIEIARAIVREYHKLTRTKPDPATAQTFEDIALRLHQHGLQGLDILGAIHHYFRTTKANREYQQHYELTLRQMLRERGRNSLSVHDLWTGDKDSSYPNGNPNAWLNITRHGRSATVQYGSEGGNPGSIWVLSYSNFERLYYNLVASYKEWGSVLHKMATWRHMSYVRLEGEDLAISFLPLEYRAEVRARFTRGIGMLKNVMAFPQWSLIGMNERRHWNPFAAWDLPPRPSPYRYKDADASIHYLVGAVKERLARVNSEPPDAGISAERIAFEAKLDALMGRSEVKTREKFAQFLPSISYLVVNGSDGTPWVSTILADRGYKAHNVMMAESINRDPTYDTLSVYRGFVGHYPNVFFHIDAANVDTFLSELRALNSEAAGARFEAKWGIARNSPRFWPFFDWLHAYKSRSSPGVDPIELGIADLSQYDFF